MNGAIRTGIKTSEASYMHLRTALFHSTPVLNRRRRNYWDTRSRPNHYSKRFRRMHAKQELLRNVSAFAEHLFQGWQNGFDEDDPISSGGPSWFRNKYSKGSRRNRKGNQGQRGHGGYQEPRHWGRKGFQFFKDDDFEFTTFRSAFGGDRFFYWSFIDDEHPHWFRSSRYSNSYNRSWNWRYRVKDEYESSSEFESSHHNLASERAALGLNASGPLKLEDVKNAYRACALKWHPDRHQGSDKAVAEEKFKLCSAAYQLLCDKLALD